MAKQDVVLFVDDEEPILKMVNRLFHSENMQVLTANSGEEALNLLEAHSVQLVISDQRMPQMSGSELLTQVRVKYPNVIRMIMSGYADISSVVECINDAHIHHFVPKPWDTEQLKQLISEYLDVARVRKNTQCQSPANSVSKHSVSDIHASDIHIDLLNTIAKLRQQVAALEKAKDPNKP